MSEERLRQEAGRRCLADESPTETAEALGLTTRWVHKWVTRHNESGEDEKWAESRSRTSHRCRAHRAIERGCRV